jgi:hypothetical protein
VRQAAAFLIGNGATVVTDFDASDARQGSAQVDVDPAPTWISAHRPIDDVVHDRLDAAWIAQRGQPLRRGEVEAVCL